jgi:hypothetical protein
MSKKAVSVEYGGSKSLFSGDFWSQHQHRIAVCCSNPKCDNMEVGEQHFLPASALQTKRIDITMYPILSSLLQRQGHLQCCAECSLEQDSDQTISCIESTSLLSSMDSECQYLDEREDQSRPLLTKSFCCAQGGMFSPVKDANVYMMTQSMMDTFYWLRRAHSK